MTQRLQETAGENYKMLTRSLGCMIVQWFHSSFLVEDGANGFPESSLPVIDPASSQHC